MTVVDFTVDPVGTNLTLTVGASATLGSDSSGISAVLKTGTTPLPGQTIFFVVSGVAGGNAAGNGYTKSVTTDANGRGSLGGLPATLPVGAYTVTTYFSGTIPLNPWAPPASQTSITLTNPIYDAALPVARSFNVIWPFTGFLAPVGNPPKLNIGRAGGWVPLRFSLGGDRGLNIIPGGAPTVTKLTSCPSGTATGTVDEAGTDPRRPVVHRG